MAFESVMKSMLSVGFEEDEIKAVITLLAGVILIGDIVSLSAVSYTHLTLPTIYSV